MKPDFISAEKGDGLDSMSSLVLPLGQNREVPIGRQQARAIINENTAEALVKLLLAAAKREDELFAKLSKAIANDDQAATLLAARALVGIRVTSRAAKPDNCGA